MSLIAVKTSRSNIALVIQKSAPVIGEHIRLMRYVAEWDRVIYISDSSPAEMHNISFLSDDLVADVLRSRSNVSHASPFF